MMKRVLILVLLVGIAGVAGMFRSHSKSADHQMFPVTAQSGKTGETREEIRKTVELAPGAQVEVSGINGAVKIETSPGTTAEIYIERTAESSEALARRKVVVDSSPSRLRIHGEKGDVGLVARILGSNPSERVTLRLPRQIALTTRGVNGAVTVGEVDGPVTVQGINGKVDIDQAAGAAEFNGINGNITVALSEIGKEGVSISGINGNIELRLGEKVSADLDANGMNGKVVSDIPELVVEKERHGRYSARIGNGGSSISANGINGNIRLTRSTLAPPSKV